MSRFKSFLSAFLSCLFLVWAASAQNTNPVDKKVSNPIADPSPVKRANQPQASQPQEGGAGELVVYSATQSVEGEDGSRVITHTGDVDVRYGIFRLRADKIVIYEADGRMIADGNVIFDQGDEQRIAGERGEWNYKTKLGKFIKSSGFTNQTADGSLIYFTADLVERIALDEVVVANGKFTACQEDVPKWSFTAEEARIKLNDRVRLKDARFRVLDATVIPFPYVSIPINKTARASGFLTPTIGYSARKGLRLSGAYYQTLGPSADVTFRGDVYSARGLGFGLDARTRANERSFMNFGFYAVQDRLFGVEESASNPDQGGSVVYADGVHYFSNGMTGAVDVRLTSNLAFRQVFSDGIQQIISPIEVSQAFVTKGWGSYTVDFLARSQSISIPNVRIKTRNLPSVHFEKRPSESAFLKGVYFSFKGGLDGVSRRDETDDLAYYFARTGGAPVRVTGSGGRVDFNPEVSIPFSTRYFNLTATVGGRVTHYSNSFNDMRQVVARDVTRRYGELNLHFQPVSLARNFYGKDGKVRVRHVIEPYAAYRLVSGINNFKKIIRFDHIDTVADTNEIEFGVSNRFYTRRRSGAASVAGKDGEDVKTTEQPHEILTISVRGKYFFDPRFGGALVPGQRNQISPITGLTFYSFGGVPRRFSPLTVDVSYRPVSGFVLNSRADVGVDGDGVRAVSATVGYDSRLFKMFQSFYYTRAVTLVPALAAYASSNGKEPGSLRGSQWNPSVFFGDRNLGWFGGTSLFFDFQNRRGLGGRPLISSLYTAGYAYDCCSLAVQYYTFNVGVRRENRYVFSFKLNGIGSFGTEQYGQGLK